MRFARQIGLCLCLGVALCYAEVPEAAKADGHCEPGWEKANDRCFRLLPTAAERGFTFTEDGSSQCESIGAELFQSDGCLPLSGCDSGRGSVCVKPFSNCAVGWYEGKQACYQLNGNQLSWDEAKTSCNQIGGNLIQILNQDTQNFVNGYLASFRKQGIPFIWIGIYQVDLTKPLTWTGTGQEVSRTYKNWAKGEPRIQLGQRNAGRVMTSMANGTWQVGRPIETGGYICELQLGKLPIVPTPNYKFSCPSTWQLFRGYCYQIIAYARTWQNARNECKKISLATDLVDIRDAAEQEFIQRNLYGRNIWVGLYSRGKWGDWYWNDDTTMATYFNWNDGEPNNAGGIEYCVEVIANNRARWNDMPCSASASFACKRPADVNGSPPTRPPTTVTPRWDPVCGVGWYRDPISSQCYMINLEPMNWNDARLYCQDKKGGLASITSVSEKTFIISQIQGAIQSGTGALAYWIGFNDRAEEGRWVWSDGSPVPFINWDYNEPNGRAGVDCANILPTKNFFWNDDYCTRLFPSVCKKSASTGTTVKPAPTTIPVPNGQVRGCPDGYTGYNNMCYRLYTQRQNWNNARQQCRNDGGDLVSIEHRQEHTFVNELVQKTGRYDIWIGLHDTAAALRTMYFQWIDGSPVTFTNWNKGEPNDWQDKENCVEQYLNGMWNDNSCDVQLQFMCKRRQIALVTTLPTTKPFGCPSDYDDMFNGNCYKYVVGASKVTAFTAHANCRTSGGSLVSILTSEEQGHLNLKLSAINSDQPFWIGLTSNGFYFWWLNGFFLGSTSYTNWATGANVKGTYTFMYPSGRPMGTWSMESSLFTLPNYICKRRQDGPTTTPRPPTTYDPKFCAVGWVEADNTCYRGFRSFYAVSWDDARVACKKLGGDLASIHSYNATEVLRSQVLNTSTTPYWIGLNSRDTDQSHKWIDGTSPNYFNWKPNQPNNYNKRLNCVLLDPSDMQWQVTACSGLANYICETAKGINPGNVTTMQPTSRPNVTDCGFGWSYFRGSCYFEPYYYADWYSARQFCKNRQADLASILDDDENQFLHRLAAEESRTANYWIGLNELGQTEGYKWSDGSPVTYLNWKENEPNNAGGAEHCVTLSGNDGLWNDDQCSTRWYFFCKRNNDTRKTDPPPTPMPGGCPSEYYSVGDKCFKLFGKSSDARTWQEAFDECGKLNGVNRTYLASISSEYEQSALIAMAADAEIDLWVGMHTRQNFPRRYVWIDNSQVLYTNWDRGEPNGNSNNQENCVEMYTQKYRAGKWNDIRCESKRGYICMTYKQLNILTTWPGPQPTRVLCSPGWMQYGSACFKFNDQSTTWPDALTQCKSQGANLASVHDVWEQNYLHSLTSSKPLDSTWIGLTDNTTEGVFVWSDAWPVLYSYWGMNQPNEENGKGCVRMNRNGRWFNGPCSALMPFICRISYGPPPTTPPTILGRCPNNDFVQFGQFCYFISEGRIVANRKDFASAQLDCKLKGGDLASINSPGEQDFLAQTIAARNQDGRVSANYWIGMTRQLEDGFLWMDGSPVGYVHWAQGEPSDKDGSAGENCVEMYILNYLWNDISCAAKNAYVCKVAKRPFTAGPGDTTSTAVTTTSAPSTSRATQPPGRSTTVSTTSEPVKTTLVQTSRLVADLRDDLVVGGVVVFFLLVLVALVIGVFFYRRHFAGPKSVESGFANANWSKGSEGVTLDTAKPELGGSDEAVNPNFSAAIN